MLFSAPAGPLGAWVCCRGGTQWVLPSVAHSQAESHVDKDHSKNHTNASEDGDEGQVHGLHVSGRQQVWVGEERTKRSWQGLLRWGTLGWCWQGNKEAAGRLNRWRRGWIQADSYIVGYYGDPNIVFNSVTDVETALLLSGFDDQQAVRAGSEARVEVVALNLAVIQSPEGRGQVGAELTLQQHVITHPHRAAPLDHIWNTSKPFCLKNNRTTTQENSQRGPWLISHVNCYNQLHLLKAVDLSRHDVQLESFSSSYHITV